MKESDNIEQLWRAWFKGQGDEVLTNYGRVPGPLQAIVLKALRRIQSDGLSTTNEFLFALARLTKSYLDQKGSKLPEYLGDQSKCLVMIEMFGDAVRTLFASAEEANDWQDVNALKTEFLYKLGKVKFPENALDSALDRAKREPIKFNIRIVDSDPNLATVASTACYLQKSRGMQSAIQLPVKRLGFALGRGSENSAANLGSACIRRLCDCGLLVCVQDEYSYQKGKAKEYKVVLPEHLRRVWD